MNSVNLVPQARRFTIRRRIRLRSWIIGGVAYVALLIIAYTTCYLEWQDEEDSTQYQIELVTEQINHTNKVILNIRSKLVDRSRALHASRMLSETPDWSAMLRLMADTLGDDIVLSHCGLLKSERSIRTQAEGQAGGPLLILQLSGFAHAQAEISQFALRLEQTSLFEEVNVMMKREPFRGEPAISFTLNCFIATIHEPK